MEQVGCFLLYFPSLFFSTANLLQPPNTSCDHCHQILRWDMLALNPKQISLQGNFLAMEWSRRYDFHLHLSFWLAQQLWCYPLAQSWPSSYDDNSTGSVKMPLFCQFCNRLGLHAWHGQTQCCNALELSRKMMQWQGVGMQIWCRNFLRQYIV